METTRRFLYGLIALMACTGSHADTENWAVNSAWVKELPPRDQAAVLFMLRGEVNKHVTDKIAPGAQNDPKTFYWMLKIQATSSFMLSELAMNNPDMRQYFVEYADRLKYVVNTGDLRNYMADGNWANDHMRRFFDVLGEPYVREVARKHPTKLKSTGTALIAFAAIRVTPR
jgi:hypothetical protein